MAIASEFQFETDDNGLIVELGGYGGPLHLLLELAREQKVDLLKISILKLADQYLEFVSKAKRANIELAADYLVMAAWLAFLKSRFLLPKKPKDNDEIPPEVVSSHLAWRLKRLESMRNAAQSVFNLPQLGIDVFTIGQTPEESDDISIYEADLIDLLKAYGSCRSKVKPTTHKVKPWPVFSLEEARETLRKRLPKDFDWHELTGFAPKNEEFKTNPPSAKSRYASIFSAGLEMVKQGEVDIRQLQVFDTIYLARSKRANILEKYDE